jgi:hypothetical protein
MLPTSTSNIGLQVTVKSGLVLSLTAVQMEELQVMMFGSLTAQDNKLMYKALTTIKLLIFPLLLATDTVYSDVPAVDSGVTIAQFFVGLTFTVCDVYPLKTEKAFVNTLQDVI